MCANLIHLGRVTHSPRFAYPSSQPYNFRTRARIDLRFVLLESRGPDLSAGTKFFTLTLTQRPAEGEEVVREVFPSLSLLKKKTDKHVS